MAAASPKLSSEHYYHHYRLSERTLLLHASILERIR
jgi:hypothetical protein